jgi:hypothetical protein
MTNFKDSQEAAFRRLVRQAIRKADFTKSERDVTLALVNHWFHHKGSSGGLVHPGREKLAKRAKVSVRTVASTLAMLRAAGVLEPVSNLYGGKGKATAYRLQIHPLLTLCGCDWVDDFLHGMAAQNCTVSGQGIARYARAKIAHRINYVETHPSQERESEGGNA